MPVFVCGCEAILVGWVWSLDEMLNHDDESSHASKSIEKVGVSLLCDLNFLAICWCSHVLCEEAWKEEYSKLSKSRYREVFAVKWTFRGARVELVPVRKPNSNYRWHFGSNEGIYELGDERSNVQKSLENGTQIKPSDRSRRLGKRLRNCRNCTRPRYRKQHEMVLH